ncbi:neuronal acetylcholine receptor subunit alpha-7-like [Branchiostoma floridae]|uniref:Neuronal acetylcholine receptor subunit alpha-7-like n=2 Tax=Branchiostoma floridae TaxID=7739 RepID=A0A9J7K6Z7_BRAFL|nr:neuronal acetylcholine receptor subunit alpha-7-like [Branchiostoma floridae]
MMLCVNRLFFSLGLIIIYVHRVEPLFEGKKLLAELMKNYQRGIRPVANYSQPTPLKLGVDFRQIINLDEKNQILTSDIWQRQYWKDDDLKWNPEDYDGMTFINIPSSSVWVPDIVLTNSAGKNHDQPETNVIVRHDGQVTWLVTRMYKSSCHINTYYFPFDEQNCTLTFASWTYSGNEINLTHEEVPPSKSYYVDNDEWKLVEIHVERHVQVYECCPEHYPEVTYVIQIQRRSLFYVTNLLAPCALLSVLAIFGFYLPSDSGERVGLGITILLSYSVFLLMVSEWMPPTSRTVPLIVVYYTVTMLLVGLSTIMTIAVLNIHHCAADTAKVPGWIRTLVLSYLARICRMDVRKSENTRTNLGHQIESPVAILKLDPNQLRRNEVDSLEIKDIQKDDDNRKESKNETAVNNGQHIHLLDALQSIRKEICIINERFHRADSEKAVANEWKIVAKVMDRVLMIQFTLATVLTCVCLFAQVPNINW